MPYVADIVTKIDSILAASALTDKRFQPRYMAGLVNQIPVSNSDGTKVIFIPAKQTSAFNDAVQVVPDDSFNLTTYHRLISNTYSIEPGQQQYGDTFDFEVATSDIIMIVIGFTKTLRLTAEQLEALFISSFPDHLEKSFSTTLQLSSINVSKTSSSFDSVAIFRQEYAGEKNFIKPEMTLFQIRYRIEASYKKGCFNICDCDGQPVN